MNSESIYLKLPVFFQNLTCSLEGLRINRTRFNANFEKTLSIAEARSFYSKEEIFDYRNKRLNHFIAYCSENIAYYQKQFQKSGVSSQDIQTLEDLKLLPILSKDEVKANYDELTTKSISPKKMQSVHTSGTTGGGLSFFSTIQAIHEQWAIWWRYRKWHGIQPGTWCGYFGGRSVVPLSQKNPPFWRYNYPGKQILFSGYHLNKENMGYYIKELRSRKPEWLHGYPSLLSLLANYIVDTKIDLRYQIKWITVGAENLLPHQAKIIESAFGVKPIQHYGMAEAVANISECEFGNLHVDEDFSAVEFISNDDGVGYKIIGTNFNNPAAPFLRYDVGDIAMLSDKTCPCSRPGRIVDNIDGRKEDYIILKNDSRIGRMDHIFKDMVNIQEAQIYQKIPGEIFIRVVPGGKYNRSDENSLLNEIMKRVGQDTKVIIQHIEKLERSKTGKLRFVVSDVKSGKI
jgi:phenylacetate-coenzyme A ligase PaaK-like adenylate-forming protein